MAQINRVNSGSQILKILSEAAIEAKRDTDVALATLDIAKGLHVDEVDPAGNDLQAAINVGKENLAAAGTVVTEAAVKAAALVGTDGVVDQFEREAIVEGLNIQAALGLPNLDKAMAIFRAVGVDLVFTLPAKGSDAACIALAGAGAAVSS